MKESKNLYNFHAFFSQCLFAASEKISENLHIIANDPSLAFYRMQEHIRKGKYTLDTRNLFQTDRFLTKLLIHSDANDCGTTGRGGALAT